MLPVSNSTRFLQLRILDPLHKGIFTNEYVNFVLNLFSSSALLSVFLSHNDPLTSIIFFTILSHSFYKNFGEETYLIHLLFVCFINFPNNYQLHL